jgi:hypothetical protein
MVVSFLIGLGRVGYLWEVLPHVAEPYAPLSAMPEMAFVFPSLAAIPMAAR